MEKIINKEFKVLDKGFIRVVDYMGNDNSIVQCARVSYGEGTKKVSEDTGLIRYLMRCSHTSPFEACEIKFHVKCPIFVARQWQRHRTGSYNEISGRYSIIKDEYYIPDEDRIVKQSLNNRQCSGIDAVPHRKSIINRIKKILEKSYKFYKELVDRNVAREISRSVLSQSMYTEFYWKIDLHNLMHFVKLRADMHAQQEIRIYANKIMDILKVWTPITYEAFLNYKMHSKTFSRDVLALLKKRLNGEIFDEEKSGLNKREWIEYKDFLM